MYIFHYRHQRINPIKVTPPPIICKIIKVNLIFSSFMLKGDFLKFQFHFSFTSLHCNYVLP